MPGWKSADPTTRARIVTAAKRYLLQGEPNSEHWLGKNIIYLPALAGFKALRLLLSIGPGELVSIPDNIWKKWALAIVAYPARSDKAHEVAHQTLICMLYKQDSEEALNALSAVISAEGDSSTFFSALKGFEGCWDSRLGNVLLNKAKELSLKPTCFAHILKMLLQHKVDEAIQLAESLLVLPLPTDEDKRQKALFAAHSLVENAPNAGWPTVWRVMQADLEFSDKLIASIASWHDVANSKVLQYISEIELADLYILLSQRYPHAEDPNPMGYHAITPRELIARWRDAVLHHLVNHGTVQACEEIARITQELPHLPWLKLRLLEVRAITRRNTWMPCKPSDILKLATDKQRRLVQNGEQLLEAIVESLERLEIKLQGVTPAAIDLWNVLPAGGHNKTYRPKDEEDFSNYAKRHLEEDLKQKGIIANREVEIRRGRSGAEGEYPDILVDAVTQDSDGEGYDVITVIVEVKGCWNDKLDIAMQNQLADRYLRDNQCRYGLYLVGWFNCSQWDASDDKNSKATRLDRASLQQHLESQAQQLSRNGLTIKALILNVALR